MSIYHVTSSLSSFVSGFPSPSSSSVSTLLRILIAFVLSRCCQGQPQRFLEEPADAVVVRGQVQLLHCAVENLVGQVQWLRDGFGLGIGTTFEGFPRYKVMRNENLGEHTLMVKDIQLEDDAIYQCQVGATESTPGLRSRQAKLTVLLPPDSVTIDDGPVVEVLVNSSYNLTCHANNGKPAPSITWLSNSVPVLENFTTDVVLLPDGKRQDVTSVLPIYPFKSDHGRTYECHAVNAAMLQRMLATVQLNVIFPPEVTILRLPKEQIKEFYNVRIVCDAAASPNVSSWRWFLSDKLMDDQSTNLLELASVARQLHGKTVACEAVNKAGSGRQSITLDIEYGPVFTSEDDHAGADPGDSATLSCLVDSNPPAAIVWRRKGSERILSSLDTLSFPEVAEEDFGVYTCTVSLSTFDEISKDVRLIKKGPPVIVSSSEQSARYGDVGVIDCLTEALPKPTIITWFKENKSLDLNTHVRYKVREEDTKAGRHSILEISNVQDGDFGTYSCIADNGYGQDHLVITFYKKAMVPLPYVLAAVLSGVLVIIIISVAIFVYRRRKSLESEKGSESSEYNITKKKDALPDIRVEYSNRAAIDPWHTDAPFNSRLIPPHYYSPVPPPMPDDPRVRPRHAPPLTHNDPYHLMNIHGMTSADIYGTYPRRPRQNMPYSNGVYGADVYGTLRGGFLTRPYDYVPPPASPTNSRFSTNV